MRCDKKKKIDHTYTGVWGPQCKKPAIAFDEHERYLCSKHLKQWVAKNPTGKYMYLDKLRQKAMEIGINVIGLSEKEIAVKIGEEIDCPQEMESCDFCSEEFCVQNRMVTQIWRCWLKWSKE